MTTKTHKMRCIEFDRGRPLETMIREAVEQGKTWGEIAQELGVTRLTLREWMECLGAELVQTRTVRFREERAAAG